MIDTSNWKKYKVSDLFDIRPTKRYNLKNALLMDEIGINPVVGLSVYPLTPLL